MDKYIETPLTKEKVKELQAGDYVYITGTNHKAYASHFKEWGNGLNIIGVARDDSEVSDWVK